MVYDFFDKKTFATHEDKFTGNGSKNENISGQQLAIELHKPFIRKFNKRKAHNIWAIFGVQI